MANVLGELFQNIADAIRSKTGSEGTMKPADFAGNILNLATSGGKMGVRVTSGSYTGVTDGPAVINHGMGATPDFVFVYAYNLPLEESAGLVSSYGFSDAILSDFQYSEGEGEYPEFYRRILFYKTTAAAGNDINGFVDDEKGIENTSVLGMVNSANSTTFTVGTKTVKHYDRLYYWFAVCFDK